MSFRGSISLLIVGFLPGIVHAESGRLSPIAMAAQQRFVQAAYREHLAPRAVTFKLRAIELKSALDAMCPAPNAESLQTARRAWTGTMLAWESAGAILAGPLLARHTAANIDFWPTRPGMIEFAMRSPPADVTALRRTGVAGRGLPALEWLLWGPGETPPAVAYAGACTYALIITQDLLAETQALETELHEIGHRLPEPSASERLLGELINQIIGAVEQLRRKRLLNPMVVRNPKSFARSLSGEARAAWTAQWRSIRDLLVGEPADEAWSLAQLLQESGLAIAAIRLEAAVVQSDSAIRAAAIDDPASIKHATETLMTLRRTLELEVAEPLSIPISFSDFDGD